MHDPGRDKAIDTLVLFPGALGDFVCLLPALVALRGATPGTITVAAGGAAGDLLDLADSTTVSIHRREIADLFQGDSDEPATATRRLLGGFRTAFSWTGHGDPNFAARLARLGRGPDARVAVFPFRGMAPGEHAAAWFARCVGLAARVPAVDDPAAAAAVRAALAVDRAALAGFLARHGIGSRPLLVVHPGSGSGRKNWPGFADTIGRWRRDAGRAWVVAEIRGPAEAELPPLPDAVACENLPLPLVAALLEHADLFLGNDSGIGHLAGILCRRGLALFGPSDPAQWRPLGGSLEILHRPAPCPACGDVLCLHRLGTDEVAARLGALSRAIVPTPPRVRAGTHAPAPARRSGRRGR